MTLVQQLRGLGGPMVLADGGDCFFPAASLRAPTPARAAALFRTAKTLVSAYNMLGYKVLALGPADLQFGIEKLKELETAARFPFICSNLVDKESGKSLFPRSVVVSADGVRFGFFALMLDSLNPSYANRAFPDAKITDPQVATREMLDELRDKCDVIVALSQLNAPDNEELLKTHKEIDVLVDPLARNGIKSIWIAENEYFTEVDGRPLLRIDGQGSRVGVFEMAFPPGERTFTEYGGYDIPLKPHIMDHPSMADLVRRGLTFPPEGGPYDPDEIRLSSDVLGQETCAGCHEDQHAFWKATPHANTFSKLVETGDDARMDCIGCHTVGYGVAFARLADVAEYKEAQCETCHGIRAGHAENPRLVRFGPVNDTTCWGCHDPDILDKPFDFTEALPQASCPKIKR